MYVENSRLLHGFLLDSGILSLQQLLAFFLIQSLDVCTKQTGKDKILFILGIHDVVSLKSQNTMIAFAWEVFFVYRGHKRAPKLPGIYVSSVESLDRT